MSMVSTETVAVSTVTVYPESVTTAFSATAYPVPTEATSGTTSSSGKSTWRPFRLLAFVLHFSSLTADDLYLSQSRRLQLPLVVSLPRRLSPSPLALQALRTLVLSLSLSHVLRLVVAQPSQFLLVLQLLPARV